MLVDFLLALGLNLCISSLLLMGLVQQIQGWQRLTTRLELTRSSRYIVGQLKHDLGVIGKDISIRRSESSTIIVCNSFFGQYQITYELNRQGLYKRTTTRKGIGTNPVFIPNVLIYDWQPQKLSSNQMRISFILKRGQQSLPITALIHCPNGQIVEEL